MPYSNSFGEEVLKKPNFKPANPWITKGTRTINWANAPTEISETIQFNFEVLRDDIKIGYGYFEYVKNDNYYDNGRPAIWFDGNDEKPLWLEELHPFGLKAFRMLDAKYTDDPLWDNI